MHLRALSLCLPLLCASPALAQDQFGPEDVVPQATLQACVGKPELLACLEAEDAPAGAITLAHRLADDPHIDMLGVAYGFTELGAVDMAQVLFPMMANTNDQTLLVNGTDGPLQLATISFDLPTDRGTRAILQAYDEAFPSSRVDVVGHIVPRPGWQRFILTDTVTDGCRACERVAIAVMALEFEDGTLMTQESLGWFPFALSDPVSRAAAMTQGDTLALQVALNLRGYAAGPMDGIMGAKTEAALREFQIDQCLEPSATLTPQQADILSQPGPYLAQPPCHGGT